MLLHTWLTFFTGTHKKCYTDGHAWPIFNTLRPKTTKPKKTIKTTNFYKSNTRVLYSESSHVIQKQQFTFSSPSVALKCHLDIGT